MRKIGTTSSGSVIVEMTATEFDALARFQSAETQAVAPGSRKPDIGHAMSSTEKIAYVRDRLRKLSPKKRDAVVHSINAMFQFNGGIAEKEVEGIIKALQKARFFSIDANGRVKYEAA